MTEWMADVTPILESVFADLEDDATDIGDIFPRGIPSQALLPIRGYSYRELRECVAEGVVF